MINKNENEGNILENAEKKIQEILDISPLGLELGNYKKYLATYLFEKETDKENTTFLLPDVIKRYENIHYSEMGKMFVDYGLTAEKIKDLQTIEENIFNFPPHLWDMKNFDFNTKKLHYYINGIIDKKQFEETTYELNEIKEIKHNEDDIIIKNILHKKNYLIVAGQPKTSNKTRTMSYLSVCVSKGLPFLSFETKKQRVLCMLLEDILETAKKRFDSFGGSDNITLDISKYSGILRLRSILQKAIEEGNPYGLVVIDTYLLFTGVKEINNYAENVLAGFGIKKVAEEFNVGIIVIHHTNKNKEAVKGNEILGSNAILGTTDGHITLKAVNENTDIWEENADTKISMDISIRHFKSPDTIIYSMKNEGAFFIGTQKHNERKTSLDEIINYITENYQKNNWFSRNDLLKKYNDYLREQGKNTLSIMNIRTITDKLEKDGILQIENGKGIKLI
jgi:hypothetical protein